MEGLQRGPSGDPERLPSPKFNLFLTLPRVSRARQPARARQFRTAAAARLPALVLLCQKVRFAIGIAQQGQRSSRCAMARANR